MAKNRKPRTKKAPGNKETLTGNLLKILAGFTILALLVVALGLTALFILPLEQTDRTQQAVTPVETSRRPVYEIFPEKKETRPIQRKTAFPSKVVKHAGEKPRLAIIIDDLGYDRRIADLFLQLDTTLSFAILPFSPHGKKIAVAAHAKGFEIMLHLPMEPLEYPHVDPGPGVLLTTMTPDQLINQLVRNLADIPHISGVNNHMGSKMTTESSQMYQIFSILKKERLFFIDSRTTTDSLCRPSARLLQVPFAERDIFIDHSLAEKDIRHQLILLVEKAARQGSAIGIGHPHEVTCRILEEMMPEIKKHVQLVPASQLIKIVDL